MARIQRCLYCGGSQWVKLRYRNRQASLVSLQTKREKISSVSQHTLSVVVDFSHGRKHSEM